MAQTVRRTAREAQGTRHHRAALLRRRATARAWPDCAYGASKAGRRRGSPAGLATRCAGTGVEVVIVRPGFVRTKMTDGLTTRRRAPSIPRPSPRRWSGACGPGGIVYVPGLLRWVMLVIKLLPRAVFRRLPG